MPNLSGRTPLEPLDLLALAIANPQDGEGRIQQVYEWQLERQTLFINLAAPVAIAALAALVSPFFKDGHHLSAGQAALFTAAILLSVGVVAVITRLRAHLLYRRYVVSMRLYGLLRQILP
ncbi:MAG: hypothetical protein QOG38_223 [Hyphomicrobiales bacterium]|nr:hypothetical protein [Solirubrobacteraceae bacterium]MEA2927795.1 hypothetical protein [Hyphomicrobiales bacterium]